MSREAEHNKEVHPLLVGAILAVTRMLGILIEQAKTEERKEEDSIGKQLLWKSKSGENGPPLAIKLVENISVLMFKPGFTVDIDPGSNFNKRRSMTGRSQLIQGLTKDLSGKEESVSRKCPKSSSTSTTRTDVCWFG